ncbi:hypothetical protein TRIP_C90112 [Candidatus Zixiibacteriota bacterium]|nr:hypothetical protein TRIP_C90112 [candidate division Zixibacteria bacterium]
MEREFSFQAKDTTLKNILFGTSKYKIPRYQRPYNWNEDQLSDFWSDLTNNQSSYFIGSFILNKEPLKVTGYIDVIDGQQRMLTTTIFISVIRNLMKEYDDKMADLIQTQDIAFRDRDGIDSFRIECGESTREYFEKFIQSTSSDISKSNPKSAEEIRIFKNYNYFYSNIMSNLERCQNMGEKINYLKDLRSKIADLVVIEIEIDSEEDAYEIFETTNARGVELSIADLLKNLILKKIPAKKDKDFAKDVWQEIVNNVQATNTELNRFLRYYWISKYSFVTEKKLFKEIKKEITDWEKLLYELCEASEDYYKLISGNEEDWRDKKNGVRIYRALSAIRIMGVSQCYVLFLSILRNYNKFETDPTRIFEKIENFTFQYSSICRMPGNKVEKIYSKYARKIEQIAKSEIKKNATKKAQSTFEELLKELYDERPSLEAFKENFLELEYGRSEKTRILATYVLSKINGIAESGEYLIDFNNVNIEHLLPQNPDPKWNLNKKDIRGYVDKLGNLTLLGRRINAKVGNKIIKEKIEELKTSKIKMTQDLVEYLIKNDFKWDAEEINKRHEALALLGYNRVWLIDK